MSEKIFVTPIGKVRSERLEPKDDLWNSVKSEIVLDEKLFSPEALEGLAEFSHIEVVFYMNQVESDAIQTGARHPRNNPNWPKVGIFAQRGKNRPNRLGLTVCKLEGIDGLRIKVKGLDAIDGSPVLDIKPWVKEFAPQGEVRQPQWMDELMAHYWE